MPSYPKIKLTYFDIVARAETTRLALFIGSVPFEDFRGIVEDETFNHFKTTYPLPYGQVPALELAGQVYAQSGALFRYACRLGNLYPVNDSLAALKCDEIVAGMDELFEEVLPAYLETDQEKQKNLFVDYANKTVPRYLAHVEDRLRALPRYAAFQGKELFVHDIQIFNVIHLFKTEMTSFFPMDVTNGFPLVKAVFDKVTNHPKVMEWYSRPRTMTQKLKLISLEGSSGRADSIRAALRIGGVAFEDEVIDAMEFENRRSSLPFEQLPALEVNGDVISQATQILRYVGTLSGLYPMNDYELALSIDEICSAVDELYVDSGVANRMSDAKLQEATRGNILKATAPKVLKGIVGRLSARGKYTAGPELTTADLMVYGLVEDIRSGSLIGLPTTLADDYVEVLQVHDLVAAHPKLVGFKKASA